MTASAPRPPRPNIFVVGDAKCGTTSLYRMLQLAEGMGTSKTRKELHFFSTPELVRRVNGPGDCRIPDAIVHDETAYLAEFAELDPGLAHIVDVSPSYLQNPAAARRIHEFAPDARIVIMLRDPAPKIFSQYTHLWSEGRETLGFDEAFEKSAERRAAGWSTMFDYEAGGRYAEAVERYMDLFGRDRVTVIFFEEMFGPDEASRQKLAAFLGIRFAKGPPPRMNVSGRVASPLWAALLGNKELRHRVKRVFPLALRTRIGQFIRTSVKTEKPELDTTTATRLRRVYAEDIARLENLLGRATGWPAT